MNSAITNNLGNLLVVVGYSGACVVDEIGRLISIAR